MIFYIVSVIAAAICLAAAVIDLKTNKIPNKLTFPAIIIGFIISTATGYQTWYITLIALVCWFFIGMIGIAGLGDIKLIMAITAIGGYEMGLMSFVFAAIYTAIYTFFKKPYLFMDFLNKWLKRIFKFDRIPIEKEGVKVPFALFILIGNVTYSLFCNNNSPLYIDVFDIFRM